MSTTPAALHDLARRLLAGEPPPAASSRGDTGRAVGACERLRVPLTKLAGAGGFSLLLTRALARARRLSPTLEGLRVGADGSLAACDEKRPDSGGAEVDERAAVVLVAELLGLLVTLIGVPLTLSLVREAWPDVPLETTPPGTEESL